MMSALENPDYSRFDKVKQTDLLGNLLSQVGKVDFEAEANPKGIENFKLSRKHYSVICIDKILQLANANKWGLCRNNDFIYLYNSEYWTYLDRDALLKFLGEAAEKMNVPRYDARYHEFRDDLLKQFNSMAAMPAPEIDDNRVLINLQNGTFEVNPNGPRGLKEFKQSDFLTYQLPFKYEPTAAAPLFEAYLNRVLPDKDRQKVLAEFLGYVFIRNGNGLKLEKALILYGGGANGKSVFFEIVKALLGFENMSSFTLSNLTDNKGYSRAELSNKLVNYASEINGKMDTAYFKQLVSGEPVEARSPYGRPYMLKQYAKFIFNCNELPKDTEQTDAFFRRFLIVPFDVTIPQNEQDKNLHSKIIEKELSGIFNWVLEGLDRLLKNREFTPCDAVEKANEEYRLESDSVRMFLQDRGYKPSTDSTISQSEMYLSYRDYCKEFGQYPCSNKTFGKRVEKAGYQRKRMNNGFVIYSELSMFAEI